MTPKFSPLIQNLLYAGEHDLLSDRLGCSMQRLIHAGVADAFVTEEVSQRVDRHQVARAFEGRFQAPKLSEGELILGKDARGRLVRCPARYFNEHSVIVATTGSGKTTLARYWALQLMSMVKGAWLFDLRKREWGYLKPLLEIGGVELTIIPSRQLRLNPLQVPRHVVPQEFAPNAADALVRVLQLPPAATRLAHQVILELYREQGVLDGGQSYPTLFDLYDRVRRSRDVHSQARQAIVSSLAPVLTSLREVLAWRYGWSTSELAQRHLVFQMDGISETDKNLIVNTLLVGEFTSRVAQGISNPASVSLLIFCDEAQRLAGNSEGSIAEWIGLIRGTGMGLHLSMQSAQMAPGIMANVPHRFLGRSTSAADVAAMSATLGLTGEQRRWLSTNLDNGMFMGCLGQGWRQPFLLWGPNLRLEQLTAGTDVAIRDVLHQLHTFHTSN